MFVYQLNHIPKCITSDIIHSANISTEYQKSSSPGDPPTGEWVLTDVADNTQLGNKDRIRDKGTILHT